MGSRTKEEQHRVKTLLSDTVTLLCKNGLSFKKNLKVQGLLGITVDDDEVFIVHLNETMGDLVSASDENQPDEFHSPSKPSESGRRSPKRKRRRRSTDSNRSQSQEDTFIDLDPDIQIKTEPDMIVVDEVKFEGSPSKQSCRLADEGLNMAISSISSLDPNYSGPGTNVALSTTPKRPRTDSFSSFNQSVSDSGTTATSSNSNPYVTGFIPNVADTSNQSGSFQWDSNAAQGIPGMSNWASQLAQQTMSPSDTSQLPGPSQGYSPGQRTGTEKSNPRIVALDMSCKTCQYYVNRRKHQARKSYLKSKGVSASELPVFCQQKLFTNKNCHSCLDRAAYYHQRNQINKKMPDESNEKQAPDADNLPENSGLQ